MAFSLRSIVAIAALSASTLVHGAANMVPDYEVKILLDPAVVLGSDNKLISTVLDTFDMPTTVTKMNVQFLDTNSKDIYDAGWSPRIRKTEDEDEFDLTYKKRYPITGDNINAALTTANGEGFDASDSNYEAQVEWGYAKKTLSISRKKSESASKKSMDLPNKDASQDMLIDNAPGKFVDWVYNNWGTDMLEDSRIFGPVLAKRSIGKWSGMKKFYIEVWPVKASSGSGTDYIVEASFKTDSESTASSKHDELIDFLSSKGWLLPGDSLKTQIIMDRY